MPSHPTPSILLITTCIILLISSTALAFDTGHHNDMTRMALQKLGFSQQAQDTIQLFNWLTDYFSFFSLNKDTKDLDQLHFDALFTTEEVVDYFDQLILNTKAATIAAASNSRVFDLATLLGHSLHAVQDFYSHSNWAMLYARNSSCQNMHNCGGYRIETYLSVTKNCTTREQVLAALPDSHMSPLYTGACQHCGAELMDRDEGQYHILHGDNCAGMNKDSYEKPHHEEGFVFAYIASIEWIELFKSWIADAFASANPADGDIIWSSLQSMQGVTSDDPAFDLKYMYRISADEFTMKDNGHWKGSGSGQIFRFSQDLINYMIFSRDSTYLEQVKRKHLYRQISTPDLYFGPFSNDTLPGHASFSELLQPSPTAAVPLQSPQMLVLRTLSFSHKYPSNQDVYASIIIDGHEFIEAPRASVAPNSIILPYWTSIAMINGSNVLSSPLSQITYRLYPVTIATPAKNIGSILEFNLFVNTTTGMLYGDNIPNGYYNSSASPAVFSSNRGSVSFFVSLRPLVLDEPPSSQDFGVCPLVPVGLEAKNSLVWPDCPATAASYLGLPYECSAAGKSYLHSRFVIFLVAVFVPTTAFFIGFCCILPYICWKRRQHRKRDTGSGSINEDSRLMGRSGEEDVSLWLRMRRYLGLAPQSSIVYSNLTQHSSDPEDQSSDEDD